MWEVISPYTQLVYRYVPTLKMTQVHHLLRCSRLAQKEWKQLKPSTRRDVCHEFLKKIEINKENLALDLTYQMGKPITQARNEVDSMIVKSLDMIRLSQQAVADDLFFDDRKISKTPVKKIVHEPLGVVLSILPWNYPLLTSVNTLLPALLTGNTILLKSSPLTPLTIQKMVQLFEEVSPIPYVVSNFPVPDTFLSDIYRRRDVDMVTFVGSVETGKKISRSISQYELDSRCASRPVRLTLEMGGNDGAYVCASADITQAVEQLASGVFYNAGQSCCSVERIYVHQDVYSDFLELFVNYSLPQYQPGDPSLEKTAMGPVARLSHISYLTRLEHDATRKDARVMGGLHYVGRKNHHPSSVYYPTIIGDMTSNMLVSQKEIFGPMVGVQKVHSQEEAVSLLNRSRMGLTASVFSQDSQVLNNMGPQLEVGTVYHNKCDTVDAELPWSGRKDSGRGWSLSRYGFLPFTQMKSYG